MTRLFFDIPVSIELTTLVIRSPYVLGALAAILICAGLARRSRMHHVGGARHSRWELALLTLPPLVMLAWGIVWRPDAGGAKSSNYVVLLNVLAAIGVSHLLLAMSIVWRHRQRLVLTTVLALLSSLWAAGAYFTSSMNITNIWL